MKFEFAKYTDITELYKKHSSNLMEGDGYIKFFICLDTNDIWLARVIEGFNGHYEEEDGVYLLERNNIPKNFKGQGLTISDTINIIEDDSFENWDVIEYQDLDDLIDDLDGGYGLN